MLRESMATLSLNWIKYIDIMIISPCKCKGTRNVLDNTLSWRTSCCWHEVINWFITIFNVVESGQGCTTYHPKTSSPGKYTYVAFNNNTDLDPSISAVTLWQSLWMLFFTVEWKILCRFKFICSDDSSISCFQVVTDWVSIRKAPKTRVTEFVRKETLHL